jgi:hypothetical protein
MGDVLLPPGVNPTAVKYIYIYIIYRHVYGPYSVQKRIELLSQRLSEEDVLHFKVTTDREKTLGLWTMKKERRKCNATVDRSLNELAC